MLSGFCSHEGGHRFCIGGHLDNDCVCTCHLCSTCGARINDRRAGVQAPCGVDDNGRPWLHLEVAP